MGSNENDGGIPRSPSASSVGMSFHENHEKLMESHKIK